MFENKIYRHSTLLLLGGLISVYAYWIFQAQNGLLPIWSDEFFYYVNARSFAENTTLRAALTFTGKGSLLFQSDAHGFAYPLLHGTIGKLIGFHPLNMPFTNTALILLSVIIIFCQKSLLYSQKANMAIMLMAYMVTPLYTFTYMQEVLHLFIAVCCTLLLYRIYETKSIRLIFLYLLLIFIASFFRPLWFFWSIGLIPLSSNKVQRYLYSLVVLACTLLSFAFMKLLYEDLPSYFSTVTILLAQGKMAEAVQSLYAHLLFNTNIYFTGELSKPHPYYATKLVLFFLIIATAGLYYVKREKVYLAATLIGLLNFGLLLVTYDAWDWREIRTMSPMFIMYTFIIISKRNVFLTLACLVFIITSFLSVSKLTTKFMLEHRLQYNTLNHKAPLAMPLNQLSTLATFIDKSPQPLILFGYIPTDYTLDMLLLPLRTPKGKPIRYAINAYGVKLEGQTYDYAIYRSDITPPESPSQAILKLSYFNLYEVKPGSN